MLEGMPVDMKEDDVRQLLPLDSDILFPPPKQAHQGYCEF